MMYTVQVFVSNNGTEANHRITAAFHCDATDPGDAYAQAKVAFEGTDARFGFCLPGKHEMLPGLVPTGGVQR